MSDPNNRDAPPAPELSAEERRALTCVLDEVIPPRDDGRLPGAGALGLAVFIEERIRETPDLRPAIVQGLAALEAIARQRGAEGFATLTPGARPDALNEIAAAEPAFLPGLIFQAYVGYYQQGPVLEGLGREPRPPHPKGYAMEPFDPALVEPVRSGPKRYREA